MLIKKSFFYVSADLIQQFIGSFTSLLVRRFILPADFGIWATLQMILSYCQYSNLGLFSALAKEVPFYLGKNDSRTVKEIKSLSFTFIALLIAITLPSMFIVSFFIHNPALRVGLRIVGLMFGLTIIFNFFITLLRAHKEFIPLSKIIVLNSILIFFSYVSFSYFWHLYGLFAAAVFALAAITSYTVYKHRDIIIFRLIYSFAEFKKIRSILKTGIGLAIIGTLYTVFVTVDKLVIIRLLGFEKLGFYSIAILGFSAVTGIPRLIGHIVFPEIQNLFGKIGKSRDFDKQAQNYVSTPVLYTACLMPVAVGLILIWGSWVINNFIPKYSPGIPSMNILLIGSLFMGMSEFSYNLVITLNKYLLMVPLLIFTILVNLILCNFFIKMGLGIEGIAASTSLSYFLFFILISVISFKNIHSGNEITKFFANIIFTIGYYLLIIFLCSKINFKPAIINMLIRTVLFLLFSLPLILKVNKKTGLINKLTLSLKKGGS